MSQRESGTRAAGGKGRANASDTGPARHPEAAPDPAELSRQMADHMAAIAEKSQRLVADFLSRQGAEEGVGLANPMAIGAAFLEMTAHMMSDPARLAEAQAALWSDYMRLWQTTAERFLGGDAEPVIETPAEDRRFRDKAWSDNALFDFIKQSYLLTARWLQGAVKHVEGLDEHTARKVDFYTRQFVDAMAPSNFVLTNPEVLRATIESRGENLANGLENLLDDLERGKGRLADQHDRSGGVQDRRERRHEPGQGRLPERSDAIDPVRADDRDRQAAAAPDHPALDQQILHPRPAPAKFVHPLGGRPGPHGFCDLLGQPRREARQEDLRGLHARGAARRARCDGGGDRRAHGQCHRLLPRRHAARRHARLYGHEARHPGQERDLFRDDGRFRRSRRAQRLYR